MNPANLGNRFTHKKSDKLLCIFPYVKSAALLLTFFLSTQILAQPLQEIEQLLKFKEFVPLKKFIEKLPKSNVSIDWEALRTIVGDYKEGIIKIEEYLPAKDGTGGGSINNYSIYVLANQKKIFYYKFTKTVYKNKGSERWEKYDTTIDYLKDNSEYSSFENFFKDTYGDTLHQNDLFQTSLVYGSHCGLGEANPKLMERLNLFILNRNVDSVRQWLKSANAEKQLYALTGYRILVNLGYEITKMEKRIISVVRQKEGTVKTCSGCLYMDRDFREVVAEINSIPTEYLRVIPNSPKDVFIKNKIKSENKYWWGITLFVAVLAVVYYYRRRKKRII